MDHLRTHQNASVDGDLNPELVKDRAELAAALTRLRNRAGLSVREVAKQLNQPVSTIGGYLSGGHLPSISQTDLFRALLRTIGIEEDEQLEAWVEALVRVRQKPGPRPADEMCPYPGLESFRTEDAGRFFGREELTGRVVSRSAQMIELRSTTALVLVGASGSGKSSLLRAGVVPAVVQHGINDRAGWQAAVFCPGDRPLENLAEALSDLSLEPDPDTNVLLVVDQFEEVFTACPNEETRQAFLKKIVGLAAPPEDVGKPIFLVMLGLRADFYGRAAQEAVLVPFLQDNQLIVSPMGIDELRRAIVEPARQSGMTVNDDLVELLLSEIAPRGSSAGAHGPGVLPLLSHALRETWSRASRNTMTAADYRATGGIAGAVQKSAEQTYLSLAEDDQALARRILLRLVHVEDTLTRRRVAWTNLPGCTCDSPAEGACSLHRVINQFVSSRLLTAEAETVEISHEALLNAWTRLNDWIEADREGIALRRQLSESARIWENSNRDQASLLRGARLELALAWAQAQEHRDDLIRAEESFLQASAEQAEAEKRAERRRLRRLQSLATVVAILALIAAVMANLAVGARNAANEARDTALSRQLAAQAIDLNETDSTLAMNLALQAYKVSPSREARSALIDSSVLPSATRILGQPGSKAVAINPEGSLLAVTEAGDASVQLFDLSEGRAEKVGRMKVPDLTGDLYAVVFSPDGKLLATGDTNGMIRLWDVQDPGNPQPLGTPLGGYQGAVWSLAFSLDGKTLTGAGQADVIHRWDISTPDRPLPIDPLTGAEGLTQTLTLSPNGRTVAAGGSDGIVRLWSVGEGEPLLVYQTPPTNTTITAVEFSPDGRTLAAGGKDKLIRLYDLAQAVPEPIQPALGGFGSWVNDVEFSDDGTVMAAGSSDNTIRFWQVEGWEPLEPSLTTSSAVTQLAFRPGTTDLISVSTDGTTRLWNWPGPVVQGADDNVFGLAYSTDGSRLAVLSNKAPSVGIWDTSDRLRPVEVGRVNIPPERGTVGGTGAISPDGKLLVTGMTPSFDLELWDISDLSQPIHLRSLTGPTDLIEGVQFTPDGRYVAAGGDDATIRLWEVAGDGPYSATAIEGPKGQVLNLDFSPDGKLLAAASTDNSVWLWDVSDRRLPRLLKQLEGFGNYAYSVAFSPDGKILAGGSADKTVRLWDVSDPTRPRLLGKPLTGPRNYVFTLSFSPTDDVLAAAVTDGTIWQWSTKDPSKPEPLTTLTGATTGQVFAVKYRPDGRTLLGTDGKTVRFWEVDPKRMERLICQTAGDGVTRSEWEQYLPDLPYDPPCKS